MRQNVLVFFMVIFASAFLTVESRAFGTNTICSPPKITSSYGLYGTVTYPGNAVVASPVVYIYKQQGGSYQYFGQTLASACGYYTFDTGGTGTFRVIVSGTYNLRNSSCGTIFDNEPVAGDAFGTVNWVNPQKLLNISTA